MQVQAMRGVCSMDLLEGEVRSLKSEAAAHEGTNVADSAFRQRVERLLDLFYADIGEIKKIELVTLFELFLLKALYVERRSTSAVALTYLAELMARHVRVRDLFPVPDLATYYAGLLARLADETGKAGAHPQNLFEANRGVADSALFLLGIFPASLDRRRLSRSRWGVLPSLDRSFYERLGQRHYASAASHDLAVWTGQDILLNRLSKYFPVYVEALNDVAETYVHGFDVHRVMDLMLDSYNAWRRTGDQGNLENVQKYAALLAIDPRRAFRRMRRKAIVLSVPEPS